MGNQNSHGCDADLSSLIDPCNIGTSKETDIRHNSDMFKSTKAGLPQWKKHEKNLTDKFFRTIEVPIPENKIELHSIHIYGGPSCGKCVKKDTIITVDNTLMEFGEYEKIKNKEDMVLSDYKKYQKGIFFTEETDHTIEIELNDGTILEGTPEHKIKVLTDEGIQWKRIDEIEKNETILITYNQHIFNDQKFKIDFEYKRRKYDGSSTPLNKKRYVVNEEIAYLMGYIIGDGSISRKTVQITTPMREIKDKILKILKKEFDICPTTREVIKTNVPVWTIRIPSVQFTTLMKELGMKHVHSRKKVVPISIRRSPKSVQIEFLRGLFESDGWMTKNRFVYDTASKKLALIVRAMLMNMGIYCLVRKKRVKGYDHTYWSVSPPIFFSIKLMRLFGNKFRFKEVNFEKRETRRTNISRIPKQSSMKQFIRKTLDEKYDRVCSGSYKWNNRNVRTEEKYRRLAKMSSGMTDDLFKKIAKLEGRVPEIESVLDYIIENDVFLVNVKTIKHHKDKKKVYDFHIPENHTFIGNNIINHNSTLARAIGYHLREHYGDRCQCLEASYLPNVLHEIDPECDVIYLSIDDPMGGGDDGGSQHARKGTTEAMTTAIEKYNAIRHIYRKKVLLHRAEKLYGSPVPDKIIELIDRHHKDPDALLQFLPESIGKVSGILFVVWGPQLPTIDQTFHQNKLFEIYKGLSAMDEKREQTIRKRITSYWLKKLGEKEATWRRGKNIDAKSWSIVRDIYTQEIGWLYVPPAEKNVLKHVVGGGKGFQKQIKVDTETLDEWAQFIYTNKDMLMPPYDPFSKQEDRRRSLINFLTDSLANDKDPRNFEPLKPHVQLFFKKVLKNKIKALDDRIIKYHYSNMDERDHIEKIAKRLIQICEDEDITPHMTSGRNIIKDLARRKISSHRQLIEKPSNFRKIFDHLLYLWHQMHPEERKPGSSRPEKKITTKEQDEHLVKQATVESENLIEFQLSEEDIINTILKNDPSQQERAVVYMMGEGIGDYDIYTNRQIYNISQSEGQRKKLNIPMEYSSVEAVKYRKKQFRGTMSYVLGELFENWVEKILEEGYIIPGILEDVEYIQHSDYSETHGKPDFVLQHEDESYTVLSVKCYISPRSETLKKEEIGPEISYHNKLLQDGKKSRIMVLFVNIKIPHMLIVYTYNSSAEMPPKLTFSPSMAGQFAFQKPEDEK